MRSQRLPKRVRFLAFSKKAEEWAMKYAWRDKDGVFVVKLLAWEAERLVVQGKRQAKFVHDPYVTMATDAAWVPLREVAHAAK